MLLRAGHVLHRERSVGPREFDHEPDRPLRIVRRHAMIAADGARFEPTRAVGPRANSLFDQQQQSRGVVHVQISCGATMRRSPIRKASATSWNGRQSTSDMPAPHNAEKRAYSRGYSPAILSSMAIVRPSI